MLSRAKIRHTRRLADPHLVARDDDRLQLVARLTAAIAFRNRLVVRAISRVSEKSADGVCNSFGEHMFVLAGRDFAILHLCAQHIVDQPLRQTMPADNLFGQFASFWAKPDSV